MLMVAVCDDFCIVHLKDAETLVSPALRIQDIHHQSWGILIFTHSF